MPFANTTFGTSADDPSLPRRFWRKLASVAAQIPFAEDLLAAYYCAFDRATPLQVKGTLVAAIAYFVLPFDAIPDMLPVIGFTDDAAVLMTALKLVSSHMRPEHREAAREKLDTLRAAAA
ncbi:MAG: DUF1232 domain-containing protein [Proteobacteria bacterium]|nr:DUF1232 domain-containing protein [Pseudomonadota bacterium]